MGPAGPSPVYRAGWVRGNATIRFGTGFTVVRSPGVTGQYRITIPATPTGKFIAAVVSPNAPDAIARVVAYTKNALDASHAIDIEIHNSLGVLVDSDFTFIAMDGS